MTAARKSFRIGLFLSLLGLSTTALAYGPAGCGLGSLIMTKDSILSQALASVTNLTLLNQFFGITSGTSGCNTNGFVMREKEAEAFAEANMQNLEVDMARGHGESIAAFAQILGCGQNAISDFGRMTQIHYESIFPKANVDAPSFIRSVEVEMLKDTPVRQGCLQQTS
jgi:hypothetical protein